MAASSANATTLFWDQMTNGAGWSMVSSDPDTQATFGYNYGTLDGIPEAPNTQVGNLATRGLKLEANVVLPTSGAQTFLSPTGQNFTGSYQYTFDAWISYDVNEQVNGSSTGTTEFIGGGVGYNGFSTDNSSGAQILATGDGGSGSDWRVFHDGTFVAAADMAGGTRNGLDPYYSNFLPSIAPPAGSGQPALGGAAGSPSFQWITFEVSVINGMGVHQVFFDIVKPDNSFLRITELDCIALACTTDGNIMVTYADLFSSVSAMPQFTFGIIDNVHVDDDFTVRGTVSEPAAVAGMSAGLLGLIALRRRRAD